MAKVLDLVVEGDTLGIVMELIDGQDLRHYLRIRRTLPPTEAVRLACQLLQGLTAVHAAGIVHRDVKPENVLVSVAQGQMVLKLTDFGVSRLSYGASLTKMTSLIGTPEYMAPELADHDTATPAADLYSAGIVLYEMLAGRTPFAGGYPLAVLRRQVEQPPPQIPGIPAELWAQIESLLAKDPRSRPGSAVVALNRLAPLSGPGGPHAGTATDARPVAVDARSGHAGPRVRPDHNGPGAGPARNWPGVRTDRAPGPGSRPGASRGNRTTAERPRQRRPRQGPRPGTAPGRGPSAARGPGHPGCGRRRRW